MGDSSTNPAAESDAEVGDAEFTSLFDALLAQLEQSTPGHMTIDIPGHASPGLGGNVKHGFGPDPNELTTTQSADVLRDIFLLIRDKFHSERQARERAEARMEMDRDEARKQREDDEAQRLADERSASTRHWVTTGVTLVGIIAATLVGIYF